MGTSLEKKRETWLRRPQAQDGPGTPLLSEDDVQRHQNVPGHARASSCWKEMYGDHRKDLDEYYTVDDATVEEIRTLTASGATADDVANQIEKKSGLSADLIKYIAKSNITA